VPLFLTFGLPSGQLIHLRPLTVDLITGVLFSFLLYALLHANPAPAGYRAVAHRFAAPTYTLYANHVPILVFFASLVGIQRQPTPLTCATLAAWFLLLWLYAYGLYWLFESRTQSIRNWIEPRLFPSTQR
jgi:peptidoglycan/LPS O-acetylase OafA/YrhL